MSDTKLLPCPFCGGSDLRVIKMMSEDEPVREYARAILCRDCHAHGRHAFRIGWTESDIAAAEGWNCRALTPEQEAEKELYEAANDYLDNDGTRGVFDGRGLINARNRLFAALAKAGTP